MFTACLLCPVYPLERKLGGGSQSGSRCSAGKIYLSTQSNPDWPDVGPQSNCYGYQSVPAHLTKIMGKKSGCLSTRDKCCITLLFQQITVLFFHHRHWRELLIMKEEMWGEECQLLKTKCLPLQERNKVLISLKFKTCAKNVIIFRKHNCDTLGWRIFFFMLAIGKSHFNLDSPIQRTNVAIRITGCSAFEGGNPQHITVFRLPFHWPATWGYKCAPQERMLKSGKFKYIYSRYPLIYVVRGRSVGIETTLQDTLPCDLLWSAVASISVANSAMLGFRFVALLDLRLLQPSTRTERHNNDRLGCILIGVLVRECLVLNALLRLSVTLVSAWEGWDRGFEKICGGEFCIYSLLIHNTVHYT